MKGENRSMGVISFISLVIGIISIAIFMTGDTLVDDNVTMLASLVFLVISLILSLFGKGNVFGKISLYISAILLGVFVLFFLGMSLFWSKP